VEADVIDALKAGEIAGLFTDVTEEEPPAKDHPFFSMENVVVTPHMASNTEDCTISMGVHAAMQIEKALSGDGPDCVVNHVAVARKG
jgi:D-3-phosphoglycerate dehydrogenase